MFPSWELQDELAMLSDDGSCAGCEDALAADLLVDQGICPNCGSDLHLATDSPSSSDLGSDDMSSSTSGSPSALSSSPIASDDGSESLDVTEAVPALPKVYSHIEVDLIYWQSDVAAQCAVEDLEQRFLQCGYGVARFPLHTRPGTPFLTLANQLDAHLQLLNNAPDTLAIIYYVGSGSKHTNGDAIWTECVLTLSSHASSPSPTCHSHPTSYARGRFPRLRLTIIAGPLPALLPATA